MPPSPRRALLSVSDKTGLVPFARGLVELGFALISTGGTARVLRDAGLTVTPVEQLTGSPELLDGRVKTLHPVIHGGILHRRDLPEHVAEVHAHGIAPIDLVAVNLYPFAETAARDDASDADVLEQIDIGGPTLVRAAAKNHADVLVLTSPDDYPRALDALRQGNPPLAMRRALAARAFAHTSAYDQHIHAWLSDTRANPSTAPTPTLVETAASDAPQHPRLDLTQLQALRYGENPHQRAAFYHGPETPWLGGDYGPMEQLHGRALSANNLLDLDAAVGLLDEFDTPAAVIVKHTNPAGVGVIEAETDPRADAHAAWLLAYAGDPMSAFGGIVALNRPVSRPLATALASVFLEVIVAPSFDPEALARLTRKKNLRLLQAPGLTDLSKRPKPSRWQVRQLRLGTLLQTPDVNTRGAQAAETRVATERTPTDRERASLDLAWRVCKHTRSNAIVIGGYTTPPPDAWTRPAPPPEGWRTFGVGAGQMSRVDAARIAVDKATHDLNGAALASDAFFPFADALEAAASHGVRAVIQPGGSVRDAEVIAAADRLGVAMVMTGMRHFRH